MIIHDPIYGRFTAPAYMDPLLQAPEVRRLSQIRLLNTLTPSLATLGELRRFSHSLGVLYLADINKHLQSLAAEKKAFLAAVLLHDIGTPPFGHLLEYHLKEKYGWTHENVIKNMLWGHHTPEDRGQQIFARQIVSFRKLLKKCNIDVGLVQAIISGQHCLSTLLFGTLDFDNIDNVARMNWALGNSHTKELLELAIHVGVSGPQLILPKRFRTAVETWGRLRKNAYAIIAFDPPTVAAQALLSSAFEIALENGAITKDDWVLTDESLTERLLSHPATKSIIACQYLGDLPKQVYQVQISGSLASLGFETRREAIAHILESFNSLPKRVRTAVIGYVFIDKGTFSKRTSFIDPQTEELWHIGNKSETVILYAFAKNSAKISHSACVEALHALFASLNITEERVLQCLVGATREEINGQRTLNISSS